MDKLNYSDYAIDVSDFDKDLEAQELLLLQQYKDRKKTEELKRLKIDVIASEYRADELKKIEKKAEYNSSIYLPSKYMHCYNNEIEKNEVLGKCSLHYILGAFLRDKKIYKNQFSWLDYRIHLTLIQMSGTGKGLTANFIDRLVKKIKFPILDFKTKQLLDPSKWRKINIITSGVATSQSLINSYVMNRDGIKIDKEGNKVIVRGSLSTEDFFIYEEGGHLFDDNPESVKITDAFLRAMEPIGSSNNKIDKKLVSYDEPLSTTSKSSIFIMTRPFGKIKKSVAGSGFFQRCLFIPIEIDYGIVNKMRIDSGINEIDYMSGIKSPLNKINYDDLVEEFIKVIQFAYNNEIIFNPKHNENIKSFYKTKMKWFNDDMLDNIKSEDVQYIICSLQNRYKDNMFKLAYHSAVMRYSKYVDLEDIQYAFDIMKDLYIEQKNWLTESLDVSYIEKKEKMEFNKILHNLIILDKNNLKNMAIITRDMSNITGLEYNICWKKIINLSRGQNRMIKITPEPITKLSKLRIC
jgi:hypothetical protein